MIERRCPEFLGDLPGRVHERLLDDVDADLLITVRRL